MRQLTNQESSIRICPSVCSICTPGHHCGVDCYVKDGKIIRVEGTPDHPYNKGTLCAKGSALRNYIYSENRIQTPLRRVGARGEGSFEPISWEEAYRIIADNLNAVKQKWSAHSVFFMSGYTKWYLPIFRRFANNFGSVNYATDGCACNAAAVIANKATAGGGAAPNFPNANTFLGWGYEGYFSAHMSVKSVQALKDRGGKVIIIDPRYTPAAKHLADVYLPINPGTDGALALGMAKLIIDNGWADMDYIEKYTYGFAQYKALADQYPLEKVSRITGLNPDDIVEATRIFATNGPACINFSASAIVHHINGFQTHRAILCLSALTGNYDRPGGNGPGAFSLFHRPISFPTKEGAYQAYNRPSGVPRVGEDRFPLWSQFSADTQAMDLLRQLEEDTPYPIKAVFGMGMNAKMFPETDRLLKAMSQKLDFFVDVDLFMNETAKYADIVLPACSSLERGELKNYPGDYLFYTQPVIDPLFDSKPDVDILCELANVMGFEDELLCKGYEASMDFLLEGSGLTVAELKKAGKPVRAPAARPVPFGQYLEKGFPTPSGKFEFYSNAIAAIDPKYGLNPLPDYTDSLADQNDPDTAAKYPFYLITGARIPTAIHSRMHETPWLRKLRPHPACEIHPQDAQALGVQEGDDVILANSTGSIRVKVMVTHQTKPGTVQMLHGYAEANVNLLIDRNHLDPYSGYPGFKGTRCAITKCQEEV